MIVAFPGLFSYPFFKLICLNSNRLIMVGGHIVFSADPVGVGVGGGVVVGVEVATCLHSISLLNGQILAKLTLKYHWQGGNATQPNMLIYIAGTCKS